MNVHVKIIPHKKQRYDTCGDWWYDGNSDLQIRVSEMSDGRYEQLIEIHERIEAALCEEAGIDQLDVDRFDMEFQGDGEPGDDLNCPYRRQHVISTTIERTLAMELGVDWNAYEREISGLVY